MSERSEAEIRHDIEATRARMGDTIEQLGDRVNPERVKQELKGHARQQIHELKHNVKQKARNTMHDVEHRVTDTGRGLWETIRENPVPAGMVGIGLAWLAANRRSGQGDRDYRSRDYTGQRGSTLGYGTAYGVGAGTSYDSDYAAGYTAGGVYTAGVDTKGVNQSGMPGADTSDDARGAVDRVRDKAEHAAETVRDRAGEAKDRVREKASDVGERASERLHDVQHRVEYRFERAVQENPFAVGALAMACGLAAGLIVPETRREHELMGRTRDKVLDRAEDVAHRAVDRARDVARETASESAREAVDEIWPGRGDDQKRESFTEPGR